MKQEQIKIYFLLVIYSLIFVYLFFVLYKLQILDHDNFSDRRDRQNLQFNQQQKRGNIFSTRKDGELIAIAEDEIRYKLIISPKDIPESYEPRLFELISNVVEIERELFDRKMKNKKDAHEEFALINKKQSEEIESLNIFGVYTNKVYKRNYPMKEVMSKLVGFMGDGEGGITGKYGLEKYYQNDLSGDINHRTSFFSQIFSNLDTQEIVAKNIVTTLEPNVSIFLHNLLGKMKEEWQADIVAAIIMKVDTGEILAMEALPDFDPNKFGEADLKNFNNPSVHDVYELGSIMKPITMAAGINENLINPQSTYRDSGFVKVDEYTIWNFDKKMRGIQTMQEVISNSLNTGAVYVQQLLGQKKFKEYFNDFGLKENTSIDFPNEAINLVTNLDINSKANFATAAFGQGIATTPLSMLSALNVIINKGKKICPHFLKYKLYSDNTKAEYVCSFDNEDNSNNVITQETANTTKKMMIELIETGLAKGKYKDKNYFVGAKTGTAQLPSPDGKYYKDKFIHSYFTFFPGNKPEYGVLIYQVNPKDGSLASLTLAPYASKIKDFLLDYYNVPPDR